MIGEKTNQPNDEPHSDAEITARHKRIGRVAKRRRCEHRKRIVKFTAELLALLATVAIAALTCAYVHYSGRQWQTMREQLAESRREFTSTQRARIVLGNDKGEIMNIVDSGGKASIVIYLRNDGNSAAREIVPEFRIVTAPPTMTFAYKSLYPPVGPRGFFTGPTIGRGQPLPFYIDLDKRKEEPIKAGRMYLRVLGRVSYSDDFGDYCEPFAIQYRPGLPSIQILIPPKSAICDPNTKDSEMLEVLPNGEGHTSFHLSPGETFSRNQPGAPKNNQ